MFSLWTRALSRCRQVVARRRGQSLGNAAFWGDAGHTCDRFGLVPNVLQRMARLKGVSAAGGMLDLVSTANSPVTRGCVRKPAARGPLWPSGVASARRIGFLGERSGRGQFRQL
eukprot:5116125-Pyramimonas_sp.AAC.1